jgi:hypothetical protein
VLRRPGPSGVALAPCKGEIGELRTGIAPSPIAAMAALSAANDPLRYRKTCFFVMTESGPTSSPAKRALY